ITTNKSWFSNLTFQYSFPANHNKINLLNAENPDYEYQTIKVNMFPNDIQKNILYSWFNSFNIMYNETILFLINHVPYCKINFCKISILNYNDIINEKKSNKEDILKENKMLSKYENSYLSLKSHIDTFLDYKHIRTNYLKSKRDEIINALPTNKIHVHSMDG